MPDLPVAVAVAPAAGTAPPRVAELHAAVGALLAELAERTGPALHDALTRAATAWDQADALSILDADLEARARTLRARWQQVAAAGEPASKAAALQAVLAIDTALALVGLVERRLATLIRVHLNGGGELLPDGRPFLDVSGALAEAAGGWS